MPSPKIIDLDLPPDKLDELANYLLEKFDLVQKARANQIDEKASNWQKNYDALPAQKVRTVPFNRASNFMPHLIRMHSDILGARIVGIIFGTHPFWKVKSLLRDIIQHEMLEALSDGMNHLWENDLFGFEIADQIVNETLQTGTLTLKSTWKDDTTTFLDPQGQFQVTSDVGMLYTPIAFEDFWPFPITAPDTRKAEILFQRVRLTKSDVERRAASGLWDPNAAKVMQPTDAMEPIQEAKNESSGIMLTPDIDYPYAAIECWLSWEMAGQQRPIVVTLNPKIRGRDAILRAIYNFMPYAERPFTDFRAFRRKGSYFGYSVPEILEQSQEEQAQIHNGRRDANTIANIPSWKKKRDVAVPNPATDWYPGCIIELDEMDDMEPLNVQANYNAMIDEEQFVMSLAERYVGISPSMQGFGAGQAAGKRGIYSTGATLALLSEGNRRQDIFIRRLRYPFHRVGGLTAMSYNQFAPNYFDKFGEKGSVIKQAFQLTDPRSGALLYDLTASDAASNREIDRANLLQMGSTMAGYYEHIVNLSSVVRGLAPDDPFRQVALGVLDSARDLADRILFAFDQGDRRRILPDVRALLEPGAPAPAGAGPGVRQPAAGAVQQPELENVLRGIAQATRQARG